jgi:predicted nucleic acid-binding protein
LTRLPRPHRAQPSLVHAFLTARFAAPFLTLSAKGYAHLLTTVASGSIIGGAAYDALIAFTATEHKATLVSLDQRAAATYEAVGATVERLID